MIILVSTPCLGGSQYVFNVNSHISVSQQGLIVCKLAQIPLYLNQIYETIRGKSITVNHGGTLVLSAGGV